MSRKPTIDIPGAYYYLELEGSGARPVFTEARECQLLQKLFAQMAAESDSALLGYCLLPESVHLVVQAGEDGVLALGQWLALQYTQQVNLWHNRNGSVFREHLRFTLVEPQHYLLPVIHKLHRLPVATGLVPVPSAYPWSSHRDYLAATAPRWLERGPVLSRVTHHRTTQLRRYEHFIDEVVQTNIDWINGNHPQYAALASETYLDSLGHQSQVALNTDLIELPELVDWICSEYRLNDMDLQRWRRHRLSTEVRGTVASLASDFGIASIGEVAQHFGVDEESLVSATRGVELHRHMYLHRLKLRLELWLRQQQAMALPDTTLSSTTLSNTTLSNTNLPDAEEMLDQIPVLLPNADLLSNASLLSQSGRVATTHLSASS